MRRFFKIASAVAVVFCATSASAATVTNGSFEDIGSTTLNGSGWSFFTSIPGWTGAPNGEVQSNRTIGQVDAQHGQYYVELDTHQNSMIYQDVVLDVGTYMLSFFYSPRVAHGRLGTNDMVYAVGTLLSGSVQGAPNDDYPYKQWTELTDLFEVTTAGSYRLSFAGAGAHNENNGCGDCGALIDNVSISPVPLPASILFLLGGLGGLGLLRRRRQSA